MDTPRSLRINVPVLTRVEGEGALELAVEGEAIRELRLRIFEPPRYFERFLEGRSHEDVVDAVARICGICPVAYQMSAVQALESAFGLEPTPWVRDMRRLFYCGEWIQSHALHIHLLAAPDFLGFDSAIAMARDHGEALRRGLTLQGLGNDIVRLLGARSVHPVGARVGGFHRAPDPAAAAALHRRLEQALPQARELVAWTAALALPDDRQEFVTVSLREPGAYPMSGGRLVSSLGHDLPIDEFERHFEELHVPHSTALHCLLDGRPYLVGPLARLNHGLDRLRPEAREALEATGIGFPSQNMYHSIVARAVELYQAQLEAVDLLAAYAPAVAPYAEYRPRPGSGHGCTEAPRGLLWHHYRIGEQGEVTRARIVPPTSQNQARIEEDLRLSLQSLGLDRPEDELRLRGETVIRNYDPCISCATHFLRLSLRR